MMMVTDSSSTPRRLDDETIQRVRDALRGYVANTDDAPELRAALATMAAEARTRAILPEQLVITVKGLWNALPEVRAITDVGDLTRMQQRAVTMCIREYFGS